MKNLLDFLKRCFKTHGYNTFQSIAPDVNAVALKLEQRGLIHVIRHEESNWQVILKS